MTMRLLEFARRTLTELDSDVAPDRPADRGCSRATTSANPRMGTQHGGGVDDAGEATEVGSVLICSSVLMGELWLVRDSDALAGIALEAAGRPVFFFDEIETLRAKNPEELRAIAASKRVFGPKAALLQ